MTSHSKERTEEKIIRAISMLIVNREIKNPKISTLVTPVSIKLSRDNSSATVYVTGPEGDVLANSIDGLNESKAFIQKRVSAFVKGRNTTKLTFVKDATLAESNKVMDILDKIENEQRKDGV